MIAQDTAEPTRQLDLLYVLLCLLGGPSKEFSNGSAADCQADC